MLALLEELGLIVIRWFEYLGALVYLLLDTLSWLGKGKVRASLVMSQMSLLGVASLGIVVITTTFTGMVLALQLADYAVRYGVTRYAGGGVALAMAREFGPMLTAIVVSGRAGSAITAEIGSMKVTEQVDALRAMAVSPVRYLVVPRFIALVVMMPVLATFAGLAGTVGGAYVAKVHANIGYATFFDSIRTVVVWSDVTSGLIKAMVFAVEICLISCLHGLRTSGGAAGVGRATTESVVNSMLMVFISNYFMSEWLFPGQ
ncbi:MAG: ABC transporter permease [Armatimonadetes bacterium]|nr:ABC transporter permease [Armatimonadota bacterium]